MEYKGDLKDFPQEVVEKMLENQVAQGNKRDVSVFEKNNRECSMGGGFSWYDAEDGHSFWNEVIAGKDFDLFFERYPKQKETQTSNDNGYSIFLMYQLAKGELIDENMEYDLAYEKASKLYKEFIGTEYSGDESISEYDAIIKFIENYHIDT